ncbi:MAG: hypothetical protein WAL04_15045 [Acidimicrobiales bacterium]
MSREERPQVVHSGRSWKPHKGRRESPPPKRILISAAVAGAHGYQR